MKREAHEEVLSKVEQIEFDFTAADPPLTTLGYKVFRYRLYPTKRQAQTLEAQLRACCDLYNAALQHRRDAYKKAGISVSCYDQTREYTQVRHDGNTALAHYKLGQDVLQRVDRAFDAFFRRVKSGEKPGYPRWKSFRRYDSMTYINYGKQPQRDKQGKLILKGIGHLKVRWHRPIVGTTKTCTIKREAGRWYVIFSVETEMSPLPHSVETVGLDVGLDTFAMLDDGTPIDNPRYGKKALQRLRRDHRRVARRRPKPGHKASHRYRKAVLMLQRTYAHLRQQRRQFHHVEARQLVNRYGIIGAEDLQIKNMSRSAKGTTEQPGSRVRQKAGLNRAILDAGWGQFIGILSAKAAEAARFMIKVPPAGTSQLCVCGAAVPKTLKDRWHQCAACGRSMPRDQMSAIVIKQRALQQLSA